ncbi:MAG: ABC transporter substrate-binding protein [Oscillospiraceae bacterium]|jgi:putative ABC transport system substrate-binding protein|nr:ABC transporter substrate-binding protein [Oscillospiraceae bacterium]
MNKFKHYLIIFLIAIAIAVVILAIIFFRKKNQDILKIGVIQIVEHEALDKARDGFVDELKNLGFEDGKNVSFDFQNAGGDLSVCETISNKFVNQKCDLILAISTPAAQAVANATKTIPILVTAITNPEDSGLVETNNKPNTNVTGTSDLAPVDQQIELILKLNPNTKKIGVLYSSIDNSPRYQAELADKKIKNLGLESKLFAVSQINEVEQSIKNLINEVDEIYVPIDKITAASMPLISDIALKNKKFVVCSENTLVSKGAIGTYGMDYYKIGQLTAKQATEIFAKRNKPQNMPIQYLRENNLLLNQQIISKLGIKLPEEILKIAEFV